MTEKDLTENGYEKQDIRASDLKEGDYVVVYEGVFELRSMYNRGAVVGIREKGITNYKGHLDWLIDECHCPVYRKKQLEPWTGVVNRRSCYGFIVDLPIEFVGKRVKVEVLDV